MKSSIDYYIIDSCSLIELNRKYPMVVFPGIWKNMEKLINDGLLVSPKEVLSEIEKGDDEVKEWAKKQKKLFKELNENQINIVKDILKKYPSLAKSNSLTPVADPFVIALAVEMENDPQTTLIEIIKKRIIVTEESLSGNKIKIPFVSHKYGIECIFLVEMFKKERWKF
ncbi:MAG: DUF4411 family protein [Nanoarchaeota archaeon]|nr:DUF4411 family protein [Nanoarchaeota archaeon]